MNLNRIIVFFLYTNLWPLGHVHGQELTREARATFAYWTPEQIASAVPLDFLIDPVTGEHQLQTRLLQTTIADADWTGGGAVNEAVGRIFFTFDGNKNFYCSGTVINDYGTVGRSLMATAAHCAYNQTVDLHASFVLFIPNQDDGGPEKTNSNCADDRYGCWAMQFGVVDSRWRDGVWPSIIPVDYAIYVVPDQGFHKPGYGNMNPVLDSAVPGLEVDFTNAQGITIGSWVHTMGYPGNQDPNFRHCFDALILHSPERWELPGCFLTGGSSGGPVLPNPSGNGKLLSVKSYGKIINGTHVPGGGGPALFNNAFSCIFERARVANGNEVLTYGGTPCIGALVPTPVPTPVPVPVPVPTPSPIPPHQPMPGKGKGYYQLMPGKGGKGNYHAGKGKGYYPTKNGKGYYPAKKGKGYYYHSHLHNIYGTMKTKNHSSSSMKSSMTYSSSMKFSMWR